MCLQNWLYAIAAAFELAGVGLAAYDASRSHKALVRFSDPKAPNQNASGAGPHPLIKEALAELLGGRFRRMASIALLGFGVLVGLAGNLVA